MENTSNPKLPGDSQAHLPIRGKLVHLYIVSIVMVVLISLVSISSLLNRDHFYPSEALAQTFISNDIVYLAFGIPMLLLSMIQTKRSQPIGLLFWLGAIVFCLYNSAAYAYALPFHWGFLLHLLLVILSGYALAVLVMGIDGEKLASCYHDKVYEKLCGGVVAGFGIIFLLRALFVLISALSNGEILIETEIAPNISDLIIAPAFIIVGISLWRKKALGYVGGLGLLFVGSMLFVALLVFFLLQPILTDAPFLPVDFIVVFAMGLICFVPFGLFIRGVVKRG